MKNNKSYFFHRFLPYFLASILIVPVGGMTLNESLKLLGFKAIPVEVIGTGSMYPSLYWDISEGGPEDSSGTVIEEYRTTPHLFKKNDGIKVMGTTLFKSVLGHGDMVAFKNTATFQILQKDGKDTNHGFIKRIIAMPGDTVELKDGFVYLNSTLLNEPYISTSRSTYGGTTFADCQKLIVPPNKYFVLGDNRKISSDSRFELGLISDADIGYYLPYNKQKIYLSLWRDTSHDDELVGTATLDPREFISLVNLERQKIKLPPLQSSSLLTHSSSLRAKKLIVDENTKLSMQQAMSSAGYQNIVLGEFVSHGRYSSKELLDNLLYQAGSTKQILDPTYDDLGISVYSQDIAGCPTQIIVGHLGGYIEAKYDPNTIDSWHKLVSNLTEIIPTWEKARGYNELDQVVLNELISLLNKRLTLAKEIVSVMDRRAWFTPDQETRIKQDELDAPKAEMLAKKLNGD